MKKNKKKDDVEAMDISDGFTSKADQRDWENLLEECGFSPKPPPDSSSKLGKNLKRKNSDGKSESIKGKPEGESLPSKKESLSNKRKSEAEALRIEESSQGSQNGVKGGEDSPLKEPKSPKKKQKKKKLSSDVEGSENLQSSEKKVFLKKNPKKSKEKGSLESENPLNSTVGIGSTNSKGVNSSKSSKKKKKKLETQSKEGEEGLNLNFCKTNPPSRSFVLLKHPNQKWYELVDALSVEVIDPTISSEEVNDYWKDKLLKYVLKLYEDEVANFKTVSKKFSQYAWTEKILSSTGHGGGTLKDKLNVHTMRLQESPLHHLSSLETLISHVSLKSRRPMTLCMDILTDLFSSHLLVPDRKLLPFSNRPVRSIMSSCSPDKRDRLLLLWYLESRLKEYYTQFLAALKEVSMDKMEKTKIDAISKTFNLLISNPEKESVLLEGLVNKLGDPVRSVAAKAVYQLSQLLERHHPAMKFVVVEEVERLIYRNNVSHKAQYYGICFLGQVLLDDDENGSKVAKKLVGIYLSFFKACVKKGEVESRLMSALMTGVNRAYPYAKFVLNNSEFENHFETLYKVVHMGSFNVSIQTLSLLFQADGEKERFFSAVYKKLFDHNLVNSSKQALFLNLVYKTIKGDTETKRIKAFIKRLLQISCSLKPQLVCAILYLVSEVVKAHPNVGLLSTALAPSVFEDEDEEERYSDADNEKQEGSVQMEDESISSSDEKEEESTEIPCSSSSWVHRQNLKTREEKYEYNPYARNPLYAGAEWSHPWELVDLSNHFHPSGELFASNLLNGVFTEYQGDPLADFTLVRFLDRFVFRNPKKVSEDQKGILGKRGSYVSTGVKALAPESKAYLEMPESKIPADELFIYRYLQKRRENRGDDEDSDADSVTSEDFNDYLNNMMDFKEEKDVDFAEALSSSDKRVKKKSSRKNEEEEDSDELSNGEMDLDEDDSEEDDSSSLTKTESKEKEDLELEDSDEEDFHVDNDEDFESGDDIEEDLETDEDFENDDEEEEFETKPSSKSSLKVKKKPSGLQGLLASAEEFGALIENEDNSLSVGDVNDVSNKDNATLKQLKWERDRHQSKGAFKRKKKSTIATKRRPIFKRKPSFVKRKK